MGLFRAEKPNEETNNVVEDNRVKIPTRGKQTRWLFTRVTEELNEGLTRNNSSLVVRAGLEPATCRFQV